MCLRNSSPINRPIGVGYKIFRPRRIDGKKVLAGWYRDYMYEKRGLNTETDGRISGLPYPRGFHLRSVAR